MKPKILIKWTEDSIEGLVPVSIKFIVYDIESIFSVFLSSYKKMSESLEERERLWGQNVNYLCSRHHYVNSSC